jgi:hypothetical protein
MFSGSAGSSVNASKRKNGSALDRPVNGYVIPLDARQINKRQPKRRRRPQKPVEIVGLGPFLGLKRPIVRLLWPRTVLSQRAEHVFDHFEEVLPHLRRVQTHSYRLVLQLVGNGTGGKGIGRLLVEAMQPPT